MAELLFTCPITRRKVPTGIETDVASLRASWSTKLTIRCSHCGQTHETLVRETYVEGALDDAAARQGRAE